MRIKIIAAHPGSTMIANGEANHIEVPTAWFPQAPKNGQTWDLTLQQEFAYAEQIALLNTFLIRN